MYNLAQRRPELLDVRDKGIVLRSSQNVNFKGEQLNSEKYIKSPFCKGIEIFGNNYHQQSKRQTLKMNLIVC